MLDLDGFGRAVHDNMQSSINDVLLEDTGEMMLHIKNIGQVVEFYRKIKNANKNQHGMPVDEKSQVKDAIGAKLVEGSARNLTKSIIDKVFSVAGSNPLQGFNMPLTVLPPVKLNVLFVMVVSGIPVESNRLKLSFEIDPGVEMKGITTESASGAREIIVQSMDVEFKVFFLIPMMLGMKKHKVGEGGFKLMRDIKLIKIGS